LIVDGVSNAAFERRRRPIVPEILYDGRKLTVPPGTNLVDAGAVAGVSVPIFCYHKDLGAIGSCRVCAVTVTQAGKTRTVMGCMTEAQDGMEVTTLDPQSRAVRKYVLEWLMVNHPHDCPICDEGGECQLQDLTIAAEHGIRRTHLKKRTFQNQFLGEFIEHEMNRCITCYRCQRFYQEYAGGRDFGVTGSRQRVYFGRFEEGPFESPFSGNLVEMCPTGVFTDKLFRYKSRVWDLELAPSVCPHCPVGCNVLPGARHRMLQRVRMRENPRVNGAYLCDRGQFGHGYVMDPARPRTLRVAADGTDWEGAVALTGGALLEIARQHGAASVALIASSRASLETHFALRQLADGPLAGAAISHFDDPDREARAIASLGALQAADAEPLEQEELAHCDVLVIAGASLVDEAPLAALAARQCARRGGRVFVMSPLERYLNDVATVIPTHPAALADALKRLASGSGDGALGTAAEALQGASRPGVLVGNDLVDGNALGAAADLVKALGRSGKAVRFGALFSGPNGFGAAAVSRGATLGGILSGLEDGRFQAAVVVESDWSSWSPRARQALEKLPLLIVLDYLPGPLVDKAKAFFPTTVTYESNGTYVNRTGRIQGFAAVQIAGRSAIEEIQNGSFSRTYRRQPPESDARMAWEVLESLRELAAGRRGIRDLAALREALAVNQPAWRPLRDLRAGDEGVYLERASLSAVAAEVPAFTRETGLQLFRMERTLGSEVLSRRSEPMRKMAGPPIALLSPADAARFGIPGHVLLSVEGSSVEVAARVHEGVPEGVVLVPRDVEWPIIPRQGAAVRATAVQVEEVTR
jgi:NADH-quinone oxidoreductase subunit G